MLVDVVDMRGWKKEVDDVRKPTLPTNLYITTYASQKTVVLNLFLVYLSTCVQSNKMENERFL